MALTTPTLTTDTIVISDTEIFTIELDMHSAAVVLKASSAFTSDENCALVMPSNS
jgi:hypothetical protein